MFNHFHLPSCFLDFGLYYFHLGMSICYPNMWWLTIMLIHDQPQNWDLNPWFLSNSGNWKICLRYSQWWVNTMFWWLIPLPLCWWFTCHSHEQMSESMMDYVFPTAVMVVTAWDTRFATTLPSFANCKTDQNSTKCQHHQDATTLSDFVNLTWVYIPC